MMRTDVYYAREEGACADHDGVRRYGLPTVEAHSPDTVVFEDDIVHCSFADVHGHDEGFDVTRSLLVGLF